MQVSYLKKLKRTCEMGLSGTLEWGSPDEIWLEKQVQDPEVSSICIPRRPSSDWLLLLPIDVVSLGNKFQLQECLSLLEVEVLALVLPIENLNIEEQK